ncbi:MAG: hypothetical protein RL726_1198 [Actinomycetota bacterium]|jgi:uncharacterized delta-60 repeat protein/LPXTG-motif cell wall-anchored protein
MRKLLTAFMAIIIGFGVASSASANDGDLDTTWGGTGLVDFVSGAQASASAVSAYDQNKVVVAGVFGAGSNSIESSFLVRYNDDGTLDTTCAGTGVVTYRGPSDFLALDMKVLSDGSVVLAGHDTASAPMGMLVKFDASCQLDVSFGVGGIVTYTERDGVNFESVALGPNGTIVVGGRVYFAQVDGGDSRPLVLRLNAGGSLDTTFGDSGSGRWVASANHEGYIADLLVKSDASIVFTGVQFDATENQMVGQLTSVGTLDSSFATAGWFVHEAPNAERSRAIAARPFGGYVAVSIDFPEFGTSLTNLEGAVLCLTNSGQADPTCAGGGRSGFSIDAGDDGFWDVDVDDQDRFVISGFAQRAASSFSNPEPFVVRLLPTAVLDESFGASGFALVPVSNGYLTDLTRDVRGRILSAGLTYIPGGGYATVIRLDSANAPTTTVAPSPTTIAPSSLPATGGSGSQTSLVAVLSILIGLTFIFVKRMSNMTYGFGGWDVIRRAKGPTQQG